MRRLFVFLIMSMSLCPTPALADGLDALLKPALDSLYRRAAEPLVFCFGTFTYADKRLASEFSRYLEGNLTLAAKGCPQFEIFSKEKLEEILEAQSLALQDLFGEKDAVRIGHLKSIRAILAGRFFDAGKSVEVFLDLTSVETGTVMGTAKTAIPKARIPKNVTLLPDNFNGALATLDGIQKLTSGEEADFDIRIWTKRGDGGSYLDGEELEIHFVANADCYIKIYHIDVNGETKLIFPNQYRLNNRMEKGKFYTIPEPGYGFGFLLGKPYGTEFIKVIASTKQWKEIEEAFAGLGQDSRGIISRGLALIEKEARVKEAMFSYTILGK